MPTTKRSFYLVKDKTFGFFVDSGMREFAEYDAVPYDAGGEIDIAREILNQYERRRLANIRELRDMGEYSNEYIEECADHLEKMELVLVRVFEEVSYRITDKEWEMNDNHG